MQQLSAEPVVTAQSEQTRAALLRRYFMLSLLAATWLPIAFFIVLGRTAGDTAGLSQIKTIFLFLGTAHVPATLFFYTDKEFSTIRASNRARYIYVPVILTVATGLIFAFASATVQAFLLLGYWAWQAFHYGRQNLGIYSFVSIAETGRSQNKLEKTAIDLAMVLGILGTFKVLGTAVAPAYLHPVFDLLHQAGFVAFFGLALFSLFVYVRFFSQTTLFKTLFFFTNILFFAPVFISTDMNIGFLSYAMAHGLQYILFMTVVSATERDEEQRRAITYNGLIRLFALLLVVGFAFWRIPYLLQLDFVKNGGFYAAAVNFLFGAVLGATMSHFVIDADAWKLSRQRQRAYIADRFNFVFDSSR